MNMPIYPMLLEPRLDAKIWGGRRLETVLGKCLPDDARYGESLESDGASRIANGPFQGCTIAELIDRSPQQLLGEAGLSASRPFGDFPLLAKFIDASEVLSVQVHPNDEEAERIGKRGKTEAWHVIAAEPGAKLITGLTPNVTSSDIAEAIREVQLGDLLTEQSVQAGDTLLVPAGATHAIGAGVLLYEIQQASDVTYRMYDWGRVDEDGNPRDLHVEQSLDVVKPNLRAQRTPTLAIDDHCTLIAACRYFALERWEVNGAGLHIETSGTSFRLVSCINGTIRIEHRNERAQVAVGRTALIPAAIEDLHIAGDGTALVSYIPDLAEDVLEPLLAAGHSRETIARLAGGLPDLR